jgi:hypothetical protein
MSTLTLAYEIGVDSTSIPAFATICTGIRNFCVHIHLDIVFIGIGPIGVHVRCLHSSEPWTCRGVEQVIVIRASVRISHSITHRLLSILYIAIVIIHLIFAEASIRAACRVRFFVL